MHASLLLAAVHAYLCICRRMQKCTHTCAYIYIHIYEFMCIYIYRQLSVNMLYTFAYIASFSQSGAKVRPKRRFVASRCRGFVLLPESKAEAVPGPGGAFPSCTRICLCICVCVSINIMFHANINIDEEINR